MVYRVSLTKKAEKDFDNLACDLQTLIFSSLKTLENFPDCNNLKKLRQPLGGYRVRIRNYRILFKVIKNSLIIYRIKHRKDVYR